MWDWSRIFEERTPINGFDMNILAGEKALRYMVCESVVDVIQGVVGGAELAYI